MKNLKTTATFQLFFRVACTDDYFDIGGNERLQAMELESHELIRTRGRSGKTQIRMTALGSRLASAFFQDTD